MEIKFENVAKEYNGRGNKILALSPLI